MNLQVPEGFRPAGDVVWAQQIAPPLFRRLAYTGARRQGVLYERKVHDHLSDLYGDDYMPGPWFKFASVGEKTDLRQNTPTLVDRAAEPAGQRPEPPDPQP